MFPSVNGTVVKSHGGTDAPGFATVIDVAVDMVAGWSIDGSLTSWRTCTRAAVRGRRPPHHNRRPPQLRPLPRVVLKQQLLVVDMDGCSLAL